jgi:hypothetical protein
MSPASKRSSKSSISISGSYLQAKNRLMSRPQSTGLPSKAMVDGPTKSSLVANAPPRALSFSTSPPSNFSPTQLTPQLQRRYSLSAEGKSLWATVMSYKFVTTEKDEKLLHKTRQVRKLPALVASGLMGSCTESMRLIPLWNSRKGMWRTR